MSLGLKAEVLMVTDEALLAAVLPHLSPTPVLITITTFLTSTPILLSLPHSPQAPLVSMMLCRHAKHTPASGPLHL